jgi:hypothetical protein
MLIFQIVVYYMTAFESLILGSLLHHSTQFQQTFLHQLFNGDEEFCAMYIAEFWGNSSKKAAGKIKSVMASTALVGTTGMAVSSGLENEKNDVEKRQGEIYDRLVQNLKDSDETPCLTDLKAAHDFARDRAFTERARPFLKTVKRVEDFTDQLYSSAKPSTHDSGESEYLNSLGLSSSSPEQNIPVGGFTSNNPDGEESSE